VHTGLNVCIDAPIQCNFPDRVFFGNHIYIGPYAFLASQGGLTIEDGVIIGPYLSCYTSNHHYEGGATVPYDAEVLYKPVTIHQNVWIGGNVVVVPGVKIGEGAVVGAGAVVSKDVPDLAVVGGNPARVLKYRDRDHYERLRNEGKIYMKYRGSGLSATRPYETHPADEASGEF
jgi:acetyltransferase-like isoleucine patch superfamily enzyme